MRRRLDRAASFVLAPAVLFLDEPTTGLDPHNRNQVWQAVRNLVATGTTVLLTTQYLEEADQLAARISVMHHGRVAATGSPHELKARMAGDRLDIVVHHTADLSAATDLLRTRLGVTATVGYLLGGAMTVPGGGNYREFLLPGMFAMTMVFGIGNSMVAVSADAARGITDRFRSMPTSAVSIMAGRALADMLNSTIALAALVACGLAIGWRPHHGLGSTLGAIALLLLLRFAFLWIGVYLGLLTHANPEAVTAVRTIEFPIGFLGNPFVAIATMSAWLGGIATWNPFRPPPPPPATCSATPPAKTTPGSPSTPPSWPPSGPSC